MNSRWRLNNLVLTLVLSPLFLNDYSLASVETESSENLHCKSTREYIAVLEFFRENPEFGLEENRAQEVADKVSRGCTDAARRFIQAFRLGQRLELGGTSSLDLGLELAMASNEVSDAFLNTFSRSFLKNELDLPVATSIQFAQKLSYEFRGDLGAVTKDFDRLVDFCKGDELALPRPHCADFMVQLLVDGQPLKAELAPPFLAGFKFLRENKSLQMNVGDAMKLARELTLISPTAVDNFKQAFEYALSDEGLERSPQDALNFAKKMSQRTKKLPGDSIIH